jgi:hypothetical protein
VNRINWQFQAEKRSYLSMSVQPKDLIPQIGFLLTTNKKIT